jgi:hypothetical protein
MAATVEPTYQQNPTNDPAFARIPTGTGDHTGLFGFRTYDGAAITYTPAILFRGRYVLLIEGAQVNFGGLRKGYDIYTRATPQGFFTRFSHSHTTLKADAADLMQMARVYEAVNEADDLQQEYLHLYLFRLGVKYERATLRARRDFNTMDSIDAAMTMLQGKYDEVNCGMYFRRGQNALRRVRNLEEVAAW